MQDLTSGPVSRHLLKTASFMLVTMVFQTLYFLVDLYWVGRLGKEAVAGVGVAGNLQFIVLAISQMLGVGTTTLVSHAAGQKNHERALLVFNQSQLSVDRGRRGLLHRRDAAARRGTRPTLGADPATVALAADYLLWFIPAMALQFAIVAMGAALRGVGNFKAGTVVGTATVIINIVLAPVLIFGWGTGVAFGVAGAALATFIAVIVATVWLSTYFLPHDAFLRFVRRDMRPQFALWSSMLKIGLPAGAEFADDGGLSIHRLSHRRTVRRGGAGGIRHRHARGAGAVHAGRRAWIRSRAGRGSERRRASRRARPDRLQGCVDDGRRMDVHRRDSVQHRAGVARRGLFGRSAVSSPLAPSICASSRGTSLLRDWSSSCSSMFQAMGNTIPSLIASMSRILIIAIPSIALSQLAGFQLRWIWYLSVFAILAQLTIVLMLLRREFRLKLDTPLASAA